MIVNLVREPCQFKSNCVGRVTEKAEVWAPLYSKNDVVRRAMKYFSVRFLVAFTLVASTVTVCAATPSSMLPISVVRKVCVPPHTNELLGKWNFIAPYLLCAASDCCTGSMHLYKQNADGSFSRLSHGGGALNKADLIWLGVPPATAAQLIAGQHD